MKGSECRLIEYMDGSKKRFIIPVYQRNYDWKKENCKQLYDDLVKVVKDNRKSHFFGSLVSYYSPNGKYSDFLVIDGQQRLTTVSLLLLAMYNLIKKGVIVPEDISLSQQIYEDFLVDKYQPQEKRIKLKPVKNDQRAFGKLFDEESEYIRESNLTANYNYFYNRIQKQEITIDQLFDAIFRLEIINITLENDDNPQLIFESLNSTGLDLSEGDKIRNFILMGLPNAEQELFYEKYWNKIEECTKYDVSSFEVMPNSISVGSESNIMFSIYNTGKTTLYNVKVTFTADSITGGDTFVGKIEPGGTGNIDAMVTGQQMTMDEGKVKVTISYEDESGNVTTDEKELELFVTDSVEEEFPIDDMDLNEEPSSGSKIGKVILIIVIVVVVAVAGLIVFLKLKKKKKEEKDLADDLEDLLSDIEAEETSTESADVE